MCLVALWLMTPPALANSADERGETLTRPLQATGKPPTAEEVRERWQLILNEILPLATAQIRERGSFYPFAALLESGPRLSVLAIDEARLTPAPAPRDALMALVERARAEGAEGRVLAALYVADAMVERRDTGLEQSGVRIKLDDASGEAMEAFIPYVRERDGHLRLLTPEYRPSRNATYQ